MPPRSAMPRGQCAISGTRTPPPWVFCLYQRSGVLPACAQPQGKFELLRGPPISSSRDCTSSKSSGSWLKVRSESETPWGPPSWLAPLSARTSSSVLSSCPDSSRYRTKRPISASVCSRKPANVSCKRAANERALSDRSSHALTPGLRGASCVSGGTTPSSSWRANHSSRIASQPRSNLPRYFSMYSRGAWCGAWVAPSAK